MTNQIDLTDDQQRQIIEWAQATPYVRAARLFGSRAKGNARPDSDVDLAVSASAGHYVALVAEWEKHLSERTGLTVHIRDYERNEAIRDACAECHVLIYERADG